MVDVYREIERNEWDLLAIYYSVTDTPAYPADVTVRAAWPEAYYIIVSLMDDDKPDARAFRIVDGKVTEEPIELEEGMAVSQVPITAPGTDDNVQDETYYDQYAERRTARSQSSLRYANPWLWIAVAVVVGLVLYAIGSQRPNEPDVGDPNSVVWWDYMNIVVLESLGYQDGVVSNDSQLRAVLPFIEDRLTEAMAYEVAPLRDYQIDILVTRPGCIVLRASFETLVELDVADTPMDVAIVFDSYIDWVKMMHEEVPRMIEARREGALPHGTPEDCLNVR